MKWLLNGLIVIAVGVTAFVIEAAKPGRCPGTPVDPRHAVRVRPAAATAASMRTFPSTSRARRPQQQQRQKPRKTKQKAKPAPVEPAPVVVEKLEDAKKVLVVGDFMAGSLGDGLKTAFETTPGIVIETRANGSSGLVRDDFFNWPQILPAYVAEVKPVRRHRQPRRQRTPADDDRRPKGKIPQRPLACRIYPPHRCLRRTRPQGEYPPSLGRHAALPVHRDDRRHGDAERHFPHGSGKGRRHLHRHLGRFRRRGRQISS